MYNIIATSGNKLVEMVTNQVAAMKGSSDGTGRRGRDRQRSRVTALSPLLSPLLVRSNLAHLAWEC